MMHHGSSRVTFVNADIAGGRGSLRLAGSRIAAVSAAARPGDLVCAGDAVVDLHGDRVLPGLVNAHDHLQLNNLPPVLPARDLFDNAREWISQVTLRRRSDPAFEARVAVALNERLLIGGMKNLLSGVTTVAHHDPLYPFLASEGFPTRVVTHYGWSHSLFIDGEQEVSNSYRGTPPSWPWIIHAAEGVDAEARDEFSRLDALGCVGPNTLIVHGVALDQAQRARLEIAGAGLIWCPSSNLRLFGATAQVTELCRSGRVALGTDSRLTGSRDLLCELGAAREAAGVDEATLESLVTRDAAALLKLDDRGTLRAGARADLLVLPAGMRLSSATRADIRLLVLGGRALYADTDYAEVMTPPTEWVAVNVDGKPKMLESGLAAVLSAAGTGEPGVSLSGHDTAGPDMAGPDMEKGVRAENRPDMPFSRGLVSPERLS
jgi:cytosine/adenosine deaminase-related metal-dependent hydrolase